jgi:chromate transporter
VGLIGHLVAGPAGAAVVCVSVFLPCYLFVIIPSRYFRRFARNRQIKAFVDGVTAAIAGAAVVLGRRAMVDIPTALIALARHRASPR